MRVLALDTATRASTVALWDSTGELGILEARDDPPPGARPNHTTRLLALVAELLERGHAGWERIERIAVGVGPGTFTGLRIGIATARALARARSIPLVGVSTLESLALGATGIAEDRVILTVLDARRGEAFAAAWRPSATDASRPAPLLAPQAISPPALASATAELAPASVAVGEGALEFRQVLERSGIWVPDERSGAHPVSARHHCRLASLLSASDPDQIRPDYLRLPDAEIALRAQAPDDASNDH
ncbi:MAG: tRNA (adenosine(37)-N6)-threonylcarbamoyltransferase complex dimerization subunit type 1 TsaB [Solirubrobacterales bacterium]|nr:tRNA (adenosine(37)-N6)-threonylcarbamoyltransferase complex dimerization subunit type 1 TsaB [Solirubrobacterales bacterium]